MGQPVDFLSDADAVRLRVEAALGNYDAIAFYGHGTYFSLIGQDSHAAVDASTASRNLLAGRLLFTVACYSARLLGWLAPKRGALGYFGYVRKYWAWESASDTFRQLANAPAIFMLARGLSASQTFQLAMQEHERALSYYLEGDGQDHPDAPAIAVDLAHNKRALAFRGDPNTVIT